MSISLTDLFARVEDGVITEYPVYRIHIVNRSQPFDWYTPVIDLEKPELPAFSKYVETLTIKDTFIERAFTVAAYSLNELLSIIRQGRATHGIPGLPGQDQDDITITEVDPAVIAQVYKLGGEYATAKLDTFAQTRGYDNIDKLISYATSSFEKFKTEGQRGLYLRDATWAALVTYFEKVVAGTLPIPKSTAELDALLPELTWA